MSVMCPTGFYDIFCRIRRVEARDFLGDTSGCVEACGVGGRHGEASVVMGGRLGVGGAIQRLKFSD